MLAFIIGICLLALFMPVLRFLFGIAILCLFFVIFSGGSNSTPVTQTNDIKNFEYILSYQELKEFEPSCDQKEDQLKQLRYIQSVKNFKEDPNQLEAGERAYNSRLKATIWWYTYSCEQS